MIKGIRWVIGWVSSVMVFGGVALSILSGLLMFMTKPEHVGAFLAGLMVSVAAVVVGLVLMNFKEIFDWFLGSGTTDQICFFGVVFSLIGVVGSSLEGTGREHMTILRWSWLIFQMCTVGLYVKLINLNNDKKDTWDNFKGLVMEWVGSGVVWIWHSLLLTGIGVLCCLAGAWAGIWKVLILEGMMWGVVGIGYNLWKSSISMKIVEFFKGGGRGFNGVVGLGGGLIDAPSHGTVKMSVDGGVVVWDKDMEMWLPMGVANQIGTWRNGDGEVDGSGILVTECDKLEEDREGIGDDMKAIWKTLKGKEGGLLWVKVGEDEKVPAKYVLEPLLKECKKKGMMVLVSKGSDLVTVPDLSGLTDEVLKKMGLIRYDFGLEAAVVAEVCKDDEEEG